MKTEFALQYIPQRMRELGIGTDYQVKWRHLQLDGLQSQTIYADNEFYYLIEPSIAFSVKSKMGAFDLGDTSITEMQYEHRGKLELHNKSIQPQLILFIQVTPNHKQAHGKK
jgi:hypothetical protein